MKRYICVLGLEQELYISNKEKRLSCFSSLIIDYKNQIL